MNLATILIATLTITIANNTFATEMPELAKKGGCTACHSIDKKMIGPSWRDVANKYKDNKDVKSLLESKIAKGGVGVWGSLPMPPSYLLSDAERKELLTFILSLK